MFYIIQKHLYHDVHEEKLLHSMDRMGLEYELVSFVEFEGDRVFEFQTKRRDVFCFGAIKMAHSAQSYGFIPGSMYNDNHDFEVYSPRYGKNMLNHDAIIMDFDEPLPDNFPYVFFGRPTGDTKSFAGRVFTKDAWLDSMKDRSGKTRVMVSPLKDIKWEVRCWVVNGKVITTSRYKLGSRVVYQNMDHEQYITDFAQSMVDTYQPAVAFVMDVCEIGDDGELKIVEINCLNCAGWYDANIPNVLNALEELFNKEPLKFEELYVGMKVMDGDSDRGVVVKCDDPHNVEVEGIENFGGGGFALHCMVDDCIIDNKINLYKI